MYRHVPVMGCRGLGRSHDQARIHGDHAIFVDQQGIDVQLLQLRKFAGHLRHPHQHVHEWPRIHFRQIAELFEEPARLGPVDQVLAQVLVEWRQGHLAVGKDIHRGATGPEADNRAEDRVAGDTDHDLPGVGFVQHRFDADADQPGVGEQGSHTLGHLPVGPAHRMGFIDVQPDAAHIRFMGDVR